MLFARKKYYFSYLSAVTAFITVFYLVLGPLFLSFESGFVPVAKAATVTWVGGSTGTWETDANWSSGVAPTAADDVIISSTTGHIAVTLSSGQTANFNSLTIGGDSTYYATTTLVGNIGSGGAVTVNTKGVLAQQNIVEQVIGGTLTVASGGKLTHTANSTDTNTQDRALIFSTPNLTLNSGSLVDASEKGYVRSSSCASSAQSGYGPGAGRGESDDGSGASHGGKGGHASSDTATSAYSPTAVDFVYDSISAPVEHGSSGGGVHFACAGAGGGRVKFSITGGGTATISGTVTSTGANGVSGSDRHPGGSSGGSIWINFTAGGTFAGSGIISAHGGAGAGGNAFGDGGGGGGGGRISITGHDADTYSGTFIYNGGIGGSATNYATDGGSGTLYKKLSSATYGDLFLNNGSSTDFTPTYSSTTLSFDNIWLNSGARLVVSTSTVLTLASTTLGIASASSTLDVAGSLVTPSTFSITGKNRVYASTTQISAITDLTIKADGLLEINSLTTSTDWSLNTLTVDGELTHRINRDTIANALSISATTITVGSTGLINANSKGYDGGNNSFTGGSGVTQYNGFGPGGGETGTARGGGGAYGGNGGYGSGPDGVGGVSYGSTSTPEYEAGSGGGGGARTTPDDGGNGGGIIKIAATTLTVDGVISANGEVGGTGGTPGGSAGGGGSGGGIKITATNLAGSGSITANGGRGGDRGGGGGGGGRILVVTTNSTFSGTVTSTAGLAGATDSGQAGTPGSATIAPGIPYTLYAGTSDAQSGSTNPTFISTTTPSFSAIFSDVESGDTATNAHIQVSTDNTFASVTHWDSGSGGNSITSCAIGARCQDLKYGYFGSAPTLSLALNDDADENSQTIYYWRLRYFDAQGGTGTYSSTTATFTLLDAPNEPSDATVSSITSSSASISWTDNSAIEDNYVMEVSTDNGQVFTPVSTSTVNTISASTSTLSANTLYTYRIKGTNSAGSSYYATTSAFYSLAAVASKPTSSINNVSSVMVNFGDSDGNPVSTTYAIYNETAAQYLAADGSLTSSPVFQTTSTWGTDIINTGLSPNTLYQYSIVARNADNVSSATSTVSDGTYTLPNVPSGLAGSTTAGSRSITFTWDANGNPDGTIYNLDGINNSYSSGNITNTSYQFTGLNPGSYTFRVRASGAVYASAYSGSVTVDIQDDGVPPVIPNDPPVPPNPPGSGDAEDPFGDGNLPDVPLDDFMPTGLIKIVSPLSGELNLLQEAGATSPLKIGNIGQIKIIPGTSEIVKLQNPFTLNFSFDIQESPFSPVITDQRSLFSKGNDFGFGFVGSPKSPTILDNGLCFHGNNSSFKICDDAFDRKAFSLNKRYDYIVAWNGQVLSLLENGKVLSSKEVSSFNSSNEPIALGHTYNGQTPKSTTYYQTYPVTIYEMRLKSEPVLIYTNKRDVKLKIDASYAPELALRESDGSPSTNFGDVGYSPINSEILWSLTGADGKKCINARFRSAQKNFTYDTFACAILDTIAPPANFSVATGYDKKGVINGKGRIFGVSEPEVAVTISVEQFFDIAGASDSGSYNSIINPTAQLAAVIPEARLAASVKTQLSTSANKDGTWQLNYNQPLEKGRRYIVSVQTRDLAGNISNSAPQDFVVGKVEVEEEPCDPSKEECEEPPCDTLTEGCEEPPCDPSKEECEEPPCDPASEDCGQEPEKPEDPKPDDRQDPLSGNDDTENNSGNSNGENGGGVGTGDGSGIGTANNGAGQEKGFFENIADLFNNVVENVVEVYKEVRAFINDPRVQSANEKVVVPVMAALAMVNAAIGFQLPYLINLLRYLFSQPAMLWRRRKQKTWGVVYNSYTKEPIDLATIRLVDAASGRVITSQVTDFHGRYFMSTNKGQFKLEVIKPGFAGFSEHLQEKDEDTKFTNLYHGAAFYPPRDQFEINYNIPLDPIVENKPVGKILRDNLWEKINYGMSFAGMAASLMSFVVTPKLYTFAFVCLHVGLFVLFYRFAHHKLPPVWGVVRELGTKSPVGRVVVRVFDSAYNKLVNTAVTDGSGRYAILVGPSTYYLSYEKAGYAKKLSPTLDYSSKKTDGMGGIINRDEVLEKIKPGSVPVGDADPKIEPPKPEKPEKEKLKSDMDKVQDDINKWKENNF